MTPDIVQLAPAVPLLVTLKTRGCRITVDSERLIVQPASWLTAQQRDGVFEHRRALAVLVGLYDDDGVLARRDAFADQIAASPASRMPAFLFAKGVAYEAGICFSCGDRLPEARFGRCWRCALAWRLACHLPVPTETARAYDEGKLVA